MIGEIINDIYRVERLIGTGNMGAVYEATRLEDGRTCAVKVLHAVMAPTDESFERFRREALVASRIQHPNVIEVIDYNVTDRQLPYLVMELLVGELLRARIKRLRHFELDQAASILEQLTGALEAAHAQGVVHRDLKPSNVLLCHRGERDDFVKVLDFGISKVLGTLRQLTATNATLGTPQYMAPEQMGGSGVAADRRADVYAAAVTLYEMLAGEPPISGDTLPEILHKVMFAPPQPLRIYRPDLPSAIGAVIEKALSKRPEQRFPTMAAFWEAFVQARAGRYAAEGVVGAPEVGDPTLDLSQPLSSKPTRTQVLPESSSPVARGAMGATGAVRDPPPSGELTAALAAGPTPTPLPLDEGTGEKTLVHPSRSDVTDLSAERGGGRALSVVMALLPGVRDLGARVLRRLTGEQPRARRVSLLTLAAVALLVVSSLMFVGLAGTDDEPDKGPAHAITPTGERASPEANADVASAIPVRILPSIPESRPPATRADAATDTADARAVGATRDDSRDARAPGRADAAVVVVRPLSVQSSPPGAEVFVDGASIGLTPVAAAPIPRRSVAVTLKRRGFRPWFRRIAEGNERASLTARLKPQRRVVRRPVAMAELQVVTVQTGRPLWADVYLDGRKIGQSPLSVKVKAGPHLLSVRRRGFDGQSKRVHLVGGKRLSVRLELTR